jgi:adenylylsulfate kinase-like enzyme
MSWAIWISGPPGSGKTAVARGAAALLLKRGVPVVLLEFDAVRHSLVREPPGTDAERDLVHRALGYVASQLVEMRVPVIIDAAAPRRAWRDAARARIPRFAEVQLFRPLNVLRADARESARGDTGGRIHALRPTPGAPEMEVPYEPPLAPELVIDATQGEIPGAVAAVVTLAEQLSRSAAESARAS